MRQLSTCRHVRGGSRGTGGPFSGQLPVAGKAALCPSRPAGSTCWCLTRASRAAWVGDFTGDGFAIELTGGTYNGYTRGGYIEGGNIQAE